MNWEKACHGLLDRSARPKQLMTPFRLLLPYMDKGLGFPYNINSYYNSIIVKQLCSTNTNRYFMDITPIIRGG